MTRVVITGVGLVSPLGFGLKRNWQQLINGKSGIVSTKTFPDYDQNWKNLPPQVCGVVPHGSINDGKWQIEDHMDRSDERKSGRFSQYAVACTKSALTESKLISSDDKLTEMDPRKIGVAVGSGIGSFEDLYDNSIAYDQKGYKKVHPFLFPRLLNNMAAGNISIKFGLKGPLHSVSTACATGLQSIGDAYNLIRNDYCDVMVCGGSDASVHPLALAAFARARSLTIDYNDTPEKASRPFDGERSGFVIAEGCGILVLEKLDHALKRGLTENDIYGEIVGYGLAGDSYHITAPQEDGEGAFNAMSQAIEKSGITSNDIDYVNAHATSTIVGDRAENNAMMRLFKHKVSVSSTKSSTGHLLGAAGAIESIYTLNTFKTSQIPPTLNLDHIGQHEGDDPEQFTRFDYIANKSKDMDVNYAMCNSFGFGGVNSSIVFKKFHK